MTLEPLLEASLAIQLHTAAAVLAFILGAVVLFRRKGDRSHRLAGRVWVGLMLVVAVSSFFIHAIRMVGIWSPIHLLSLATLLALGCGVWLARSGRIAAHRRTMQATYLGALVVAGFFTFMPGRIMHEVLFGGPRPWLGIGMSVALLGAVAALAWRVAGPAGRGSRSGFAR